MIKTYIVWLEVKCKDKNKVFEIKMFCKKNYKVVIIMRFIWHQKIVPRMSIVNALLILNIN